jgi:NADH dehydrogenase/NADH:ubiquinone oxidoreductase 75 kD subunit (chain G)
MNQDISRVGGGGVGFVNKYFDKKFEQNIKENIEANKPVIFLLGLDEIDPKNLEQAFVVYIGHHGDLNAHHAEIILPSPA